MAGNFLDQILSKLGAGSKDIVCVAVTPGVGLEVIQIDGATKTVKLYNYKPLDYNETMREIANYDVFKEQLEELFKEVHINIKNVNLLLSLPSVHWGKIELPLLLNDENITGAIISEVEQSYIFKKCEPVVNWFEVLGTNKSEVRTILYSAIQKQVLDKLNAIFTELGANIKLVENSVVTTLRGLAYCNLLTDNQMADGVSWNLMLITPTGYSLVSMFGKNMVDYYEEPIAFKTYELEEVYDAINASAQLALMNFPANYLYIVSQTDLVSAEHLASKLQVEGTIIHLDDNAYKKEPPIQVSLDILPNLVPKISLLSVGIAAYMNYDYPMRVNYLNNSSSDAVIEVDNSISFNFNGKEVTLVEPVLQKIAIAIALVLVLPVLAAMLLLPNIEKSKQSQLDDMNSQIQVVDAEIKKLTDQSNSGSFDVKKEIEKVVKSNRSKLMSYSALGESVPRNLWITYFKTNGENKIYIKGASDDVEDIYRFFKNMKDSLIDSDLRLYKLEMNSTSIDDAVNSSSGYIFEITNMSDGELNPPKKDKDKKSKDNKKDNNDNKQDDSDNGKKEVKDLEPVNVE